MNKKEKFVTGVKAAYKATFHKGSALGRMGYLHDELEVVANDINYLAYSVSNILMYKTSNEICQKGISEFCKKKYKAAFELFTRCDAAYCLAICHLYGKGTKKDANRAVNILKKNQERSLCCKQLLGRCFIEGRGVPQNKKKAYDLLEQVLNRLYEANSDICDDYMLPEIYFYCGEYNHESGKEKEAVEYLQKSAIDGNFGQAYYLLGRYYFESDYLKARQYFDEARKRGISVAVTYYKDEREEVCDESIDMGVSEKTMRISEMTENIVHITEHSAQIMDNATRMSANNKVRKTDLERIKIEAETNKINAETSKINAENEKKRAALKKMRWENREEKQRKKNEERKK